MAITGKGRCPLCYRWIHDTDPVKGRNMPDGHAHLCHKRCVDAKDNPIPAEQLGHRRDIPDAVERDRLVQSVGAQDADVISRVGSHQSVLPSACVTVAVASACSAPRVTAPAGA